MQPPDPPSSWYAKPPIVLAVCLLAAVAVYASALGNGFYNDDALFLNHARDVVARPLAMFTERPLNYYRPVWSAYVTIQYVAFGLEPMGYFVVGVLLHGLTGFLVWRLARRFLPDDPIPALFAGLSFIALFAHSEAVLWIAAHNSVLACTLAVATVLLHLRAVESGKVRWAVATLVAFYLTLLTKEPGIVLLGWLPLAELFARGPRSLFTRGSIVRYALLITVVVLYVASNERLLETITGAQQHDLTEFRATAGYVRPDRVLAASGWMFSPEIHRYDDGDGRIVIAALLGLLVAVLLFRRRLLPQTLFFLSLLLSAMVLSSTTFMQQPNSSRVYYFPTVGAALLVGVIASLFAGGGRGRRIARIATWTGLSVWLLVNASRVWELNRAEYRLISTAQTTTASQLRPYVESTGSEGRPVHLMEPWIDNIMHLREFLRLYHGIPAERVQRHTMPRSQAREWLARQLAGEGRGVILDWEDGTGLVEASAVPSHRDAAPGNPRSADTGVRYPTLRVTTIQP